MIRGRFRLLIGTTMVLTLIAGQVDKVLAQAETKEVKEAQKRPAARLDVDFAGGKLIDYVETIRRSCPKGTANIVVMPSAKELEVPPVSLVSVTVEAAVRLLEGMYTMPSGRKVGADVEAYRIGASPDMVFKVVLRFYKFSRIASSVWSLTELFEGQSESEVLGAIDVVQSLFSGKAEIKFHPATKLLIARGTKEQLDLVQQVIDQLIQSEGKKQHRILRLRLTIKKLMDQLQEGMTAKINADAALAEAKVVLDEEGSDKPEYRSDMIELKSDVKRAQAQYDLANDRLKRINEQLKKAQDALAELTGSNL